MYFDLNRIHIVSPYFETRLLTSALWRDPQQKLWSCCCWLVSDGVLPPLCECWQTGCRVHTVRAGGGKPVTLTYLLWFQSPPHPHLQAHSSCPSSSSPDGFTFKDLLVRISSTSHLFYLKLCISREIGLCLSWLMMCVFENKTELCCPWMKKLIRTNSDLSDLKTYYTNKKIKKQ